MKSYLKSIACLFFIGTASLSAAETPVMFTQLSGRSTSNDIWVEITRQGLEKNNIKYNYVVDTCATSVEAWNKAGNRDPAVMLYSSNWLRHALVSGNPCQVKDHDRVTVLGSMRAPWLLCRNKKTSRPWDAAGVTLGYHAPSTPGKDIVKDINASNGWKWKAVSTKGSAENLLLLTNGDLDYGFIAAPYARSKIGPNSPLECVLSWKRGDSLPFFLDRIKMANDPSELLYYTQVIIAKNLNPAQEKALRDTYNIKINQQFRDWVTNQGDYIPPTESGEKYMKRFENSVKSAIEKYGD